MPPLPPLPPPPAEPAPAHRPLARPLARVSAERCTGCGWCVGACPWQLLSLQTVHWKKRATLADDAACTGCGLCLPRCQFGALALVERAGASAADTTPEVDQC